MMEAVDSYKQGQEPKIFTTGGERWKHIAASRIQRRSPKQKWHRFVDHIRERHTSQGARFGAIANRVQAETQREECSPPDLQKHALDPAVERSSHSVLDARLKEFLAGILDIRIPVVKIYTNQASDALTREHKADALTYPGRILFRAGKYEPRSAEGIALLGHELMHAAQTRVENQTAPEYMVPQIFERQELVALENEKKVLHYFSSPASPQRRSDVPKPTSLNDLGRPFQPIRPRARQPKAALSSRDVDLPPEINAGSDSTPQLSEQQLNQIKHEVYRDLMDRIRIEFERGA